MDIKDTVLFLLTFLILGLLVVPPPVVVWRSLSWQVSEGVAWLRPALALLGPFPAAYIFIVLMWLPAYSGECGGWLGETYGCSSFGQYAIDTMFITTMTLAKSGLFGILLGIAFLVLLLIRRNISHPTM